MQKKTYKVENIELLIVDFFNGEISEDEIGLLNNWLAQRDQHVKQFNNALTAWIASGKRIKISQDQIEQELSVVKSSLEGSDKKPIGHRFWNYYKIAPSWILFIILGGILNHFIFHK